MGACNSHDRNIHVYQLPYTEEEIINAIDNAILLNNKQHANQNWITASDKSTLLNYLTSVNKTLFVNNIAITNDMIINLLLHCGSLENVLYQLKLIQSKELK